MNTEVPAITKVKFKKGKKIKILILCLVVLLIASAVFTFITIRKGKTASNIQQRTATVVKGNLDISIAGSSSLESSNRRELSPKVTSKINKINFKEGDEVKEGDVIFELDDTDALLNIEDTKNQIAQTQLTQENNIKSISGLNIKAPYSGQVTGILLKSGDTVGKGSVVLTITDLSKLKLILPFGGKGIEGVTKGKKADVYLQDLMQSVEGTVTYVSSKPYSTAAGGELYNVEIQIDNPGSLKEGMQASAEIQTPSGIVSSVENGALAYLNSTKLRSDAGGTVKTVNAMENQYVNAGDTLLEITNDDLKLTLDTTDLKLQNLQRQLEIQTEQLAYYKITAPNSGMITSLTAKEGDTVKQGDVLAVVADMGHMQFSVSVDELDIAKVQVGQRVDITVDALEETTTKPLTGQVTKTAMEGTSSGGVTTYPVTISVNETDKLKAGMNANATIYISEKKDVLMVPLEAVQKMGNRSFVWVKSNGTNQANGSGQWKYGGNNTRGNRNNTNGSDNGGNSQTQGQQNSQQNGQQQNGNQSGSSAQGNRRNMSASNPYYAGAVIMPVETGINNDTYIEITSGLKEGDIVILPQVTTSSKTNNTQTNSGLGLGGMLGGGGGMNGGYQRFNNGDNGGGNNQRIQKSGD